MPPYPSDTPDPGRRSRFVTLCQQLLALAVVIAVLTPAARTVTMDVRPADPIDVAPGGLGLRSAEFPSTVPTKPVATDVDEYPLTAPAGRGRAALRASAKALRASAKAVRGGSSITSDPLPVEGYGTVGVTWAPGSKVDEEGIKVLVRTKNHGAWTGWTEAEFHDEHAPDPKSKEARGARPGTEPILVGEVDAVQVQVATKQNAPSDMKLAVIQPGEATATAKQTPSIDTGRLAAREGETVEPEAETPEGDTGTDGEDLDLQAGTYTPRPKIYSRRQWGANEAIRDKGSLSFYEVHAGFVHHTVNANNYTPDQVPGIIRGIYSYHVRSRGWSDIGYNFLVDRFGRIWEGRYGGVDRPVVGAHTSGYNQYSFAMSAIGNFETARPSSAMLNAYGALFAWKLSLHGVNAASTAQRVGSKTFRAINGHRDAGSTACPGKYLYAQLPTIRALASRGQRGWAGREILGNYIGGAEADLLTRRKRDNRLEIQALTQREGRWMITRRVNTGIDISWATALYKAGDWDRDGYDDVLARRRGDGGLILFRGKGGARFHPSYLLIGGIPDITLLSAVGDVTGDGWPDLMGQRKGVMRIYPGRGRRGVGASYAAYSGIRGSQQVGVGRWNGDGAPDSLVRNGGRVTLYRGNGPGGWTSSRVLPTSVAGYDWIVGMGPYSRRASVIVRRASDATLFLIPRTRSGFGAPMAMNRRPNYDLAG
ncbi:MULTISPECIES: N-acetylmuramoyl-L-alanine amidase [Nocardioides]|uniref:N-acetylmuramoyl-L-alanine amidase n=1 Tax=Nocardioides vastitatis TaxID=2568655 RepID=A0ABW0ZHN7_9ACTN|nr:N-acetylmuramoyl-L-alanine amidase [Nocardioides sp.]THI94046.1 hypothetical protein E7Z54_20515 [Nocardioides sp.]